MKRKIIIFTLWMLLWQLLDWSIHQTIFVAGPVDTFWALIRLIPQQDFWDSIQHSMRQIGMGFLSAFVIGVCLGGISFKISFIDEFLRPAVNLIRSVPVASFIVLALLWVGSKGLAILISFLIAFPIFYENMLSGLLHMDKKMLELCKVFSIPTVCKLCMVYWHQLLPMLRTSCKNAMGMAWKAGIAAEVIGVPAKSLGEKLYYAKIYLDTGELFAWTLVIMLCSALTGKLMDCFLLSIDYCMRHFSGTGKKKSDFHMPSIKLQNVSKKYNDTIVLNKISMEIPYGSIIAITGKSGIGKTTLLRLITGLEKQSEGNIETNEAKMSIVFQEDRLIENLYPWQNCRMTASMEGLGRTKQEMNTILEEILPKSCHKKIIAQFSGGMKRRVAIARAIFAFSHVIVLDEPFSGLDEDNREKNIQFIKKYRMGRTILFTTHREEDIIALQAKKISLSHSENM